MEVKLRIARRSRFIGVTMLTMQADPMLEWRRLTEHYRELGDDELRELDADLNDLTETAQQALRAEMRSRGLGDAVAASPMPLPSSAPPLPAAAHLEPEPGPEYPGFYTGYFGRMPELVADAPGVADDEGAHDYTWKTDLCDCDTNQQAQELSAALLKAGIENWVQQAREFGRRYPRVLVAADQLEQARAIAACPISPEIVAESEAKVPDFTPPSCPDCGAADPVLEGVDPVNSWKCEQCGQEWTDSVPTESTTTGP